MPLASQGPSSNSENMCMCKRRTSASISSRSVITKLHSAILITTSAYPNLDSTKGFSNACLPHYTTCIKPWCQQNAAHEYCTWDGQSMLSISALPPPSWLYRHPQLPAYLPVKERTKRSHTQLDACVWLQRKKIRFEILSVTVQLAQKLCDLRQWIARRSLSKYLIVTWHKSARVWPSTYQADLDHRHVVRCICIRGWPSLNRKTFSAKRCNRYAG